MPDDQGRRAEAKALWMAQARPVRTVCLLGKRRRAYIEEGRLPGESLEAPRPNRLLA